MRRDGPADRPHQGETRFVTPADLSDAEAARCAELALAAHEALGLRDLSRTDLIVRDGEPVFIEVNVAPGMTETSLFPQAAAAGGHDLGVMYRGLVELALADPALARG